MESAPITPSDYCIFLTMEINNYIAWLRVQAREKRNRAKTISVSIYSYDPARNLVDEWTVTILLESGRDVSSSHTELKRAFELAAEKIQPQVDLEKLLGCKFLESDSEVVKS